MQTNAMLHRNLKFKVNANVAPKCQNAKTSNVAMKLKIGQGKPMQQLEKAFGNTKKMTWNAPICMILVCLLIGSCLGYAKKGRTSLLEFKQALNMAKRKNRALHRSSVHSSNDKDDMKCVLCQFFVEKTIAELNAPLFNLQNFQRELSTQSSKTESGEEATSLLETTSALKYPRSLYDPNFHRVRIYPINTRDNEKAMTSYMYRVIDLMMERTCELDMPRNIYNLICTSFYEHQDDISALLVHNVHNPAIVCTHIPDMCTNTYIEQTVHGHD